MLDLTSSPPGDRVRDGYLGCGLLGALSEGMRVGLERD